MRKRTVHGGSVLYITKQPADCIYLVVNGEVIADTEYIPGSSAEYPYIASSPNNCYVMSNGSMLGEEAFLGSDKGNGHFYQSTVAVISNTAVIFEISGHGLEFLVEKLNGSRYSALAYKELSPWSVPVTQADSNCIYTMFNSLRKCISESNPHRGTLTVKPQRGTTMNVADLGMSTANSKKSTNSPNRGTGAGSRNATGSRKSPSRSRSPKKTPAYGMRRGGTSHSQADDEFAVPWHQQSLDDQSTINISNNSNSTYSSRMFDEADGKRYMELPVTVMQYALKLRRDHIKEETKKIRIQAKDNILHDELRKHAVKNAKSKFVASKLEKTQKQLHHNVDAYQRRCVNNKVR